MAASHVLYWRLGSRKQPVGWDSDMIAPKLTTERCDAYKPEFFVMLFGCIIRRAGSFFLQRVS